MEDNGEESHNVRCHRTDGRSWRCDRIALDGKKLCHIHHLQGMHRQHKRKVPESLKIQRKLKRLSFRNGGSDHLPAGKKIRKKKRKEKIKRTDKRDLELELLRMVLKREVEKRNKRKNERKDDDDNKDDIYLQKIQKWQRVKRRKNVDEEGTEQDGKNKVTSLTCEGTRINGFKEKERYREDEEEEEELTRDLPNGLMAISPPSLNKLNSSNNNSMPSSFGCDCKKCGEITVGGNGGVARSFRSKNVEHSPVGALQDSPFKNDMIRMRKTKVRRCHLCKNHDLRSLIRCSGCRKEFFCFDCMKDKYIEKKDDVLMACPVCRKTCNCKTCLGNQSRDTESEDASEEKNKVGKVLHFHYLICILLPMLKKIIKDHDTELQIEADLRGQKLGEIEIQEPETSCSQQCYCNNCKASITDLHRSCPNCSYNLCLSCCQDIIKRSLPWNQKNLISKRFIRRVTSKQVYASKCHGNKRLDKATMMTKRKAYDKSGGIHCPSLGFGGCGDSTLYLTSMFPVNWIKDLEVSAEEVVGCYDVPEALDASSSCSVCLEMNHVAAGIETLQEAAKREGTSDNNLFCPSSLDIRNDNFDHFQKHWGKGQPVIVRNLSLTADLSWDPIVMFCTYLKNNITKSENEQYVNCMDWFEVEIGLKQLFVGSFKGPSNSNLWHERLKLNGWLPTQLFHQYFPAHYAEILNALPLPEYMEPNSGILNIASEKPQESLKADLGPFVYISYSSGESSGQHDNMTKLRYDSYDGVNILVHASDAQVSSEQLNYIRKLLKRHKEKNNVGGPDAMDTENVEDVDLHDMINKEMHLHKKVTRVSWFSAATHEPDSSITNDGASNLSSDSETDTDTEVSKFVVRSKPTRRLESNNFKQRTGDRVGHTKNESFPASCGAQWDVFRRQDVPKLTEYLKRCTGEFNHTHSKKDLHPILDQNIFLDSMHKARLKQEFDIEPWTFEQNVGEAVIIPAGCPYQIRNLKSCVNVVLDFISPENVSECIQLVNELCSLPENHKAKGDSLEVKKMAVCRIGRAVKEIRELTQADSVG